tara:strand:+ start:191 stop:598 length:408 start_codon:yes stop_codon:yes gene_type:complete
MGVNVITKFNPDDLVIWERKGEFAYRNAAPEVKSQHKISSIRIDVFNSYQWKTVEGKVESLKGAWFSFLSMVTLKNHKKASDYGKQANECFKKVRDKKEIETSGIEIKIYYLLDGYLKPVPEEELSLVPIKEITT